MGRKVCVELDEAGEASYFRSMEAAAAALQVPIKALKEAIESGTPVSGTKTRARAVPWKRLQKDRRFFTICYAVPWNYRCGLDKIAEEMNLTMTGLIRHCVLSTFTEEELWYKASQSEGFLREKFQPLPQGKPRVWLNVDRKRRGKPKKWIGKVRPNYAKAKPWWEKDKADKKEYLTKAEQRALKRIRQLNKIIQARLGVLKDIEDIGGDEEKANLRRGNGRSTAQAKLDRLSRNQRRKPGRPRGSTNIRLRAPSRRKIREIRRKRRGT